VSLATLVALCGLATLAIGIGLYERSAASAREISLIATLGAVCAASRVLLAPFPSAKPVTAIVICTGIALGPRAGAATGALAAPLSNLALGQGPWTPWQMLAWSLVGASAGLLGPLLERSRLVLVAFGVAWGILYGALLDLWLLAAYGPAFTVGAFTALHARALPFDLVHAVTTGVLLAVAAPSLLRLLGRYGRRLRVLPYPELLEDPA